MIPGGFGYASTWVAACCCFNCIGSLQLNIGKMEAIKTFDDGQIMATSSTVFAFDYIQHCYTVIHVIPIYLCHGSLVFCCFFFKVSLTLFIVGVHLSPLWLLFVDACVCLLMFVFSS